MALLEARRTTSTAAVQEQWQRHGPLGCLQLCSKRWRHTKGAVIHAAARGGTYTLEYAQAAAPLCRATSARGRTWGHRLRKAHRSHADVDCIHEELDRASVAIHAHTYCVPGAEASAKVLKLTAPSTRQCAVVAEKNALHASAQPPRETHLQVQHFMVAAWRDMAQKRDSGK